MDLTLFQNETYKKDADSNRVHKEAKITVFQFESFIYFSF